MQKTLYFVIFQGGTDPLNPTHTGSAHVTALVTLVGRVEEFSRKV